MTSIGLILMYILLGWVMYKVCVLGIKLAWGVLKITLAIILFPVIVIGLIFFGMISIAIILMIIASIILFFIA